jgi:microcystin-dependent protein
MGGYLVTALRFRGLSVLGVPLPGGKLWSYVAGTATPAPTYADEAMTVLNANPIILDSGGRAVLYVPDASVREYKFVLMDANNVVIESQDGIAFPAIVTPAVPTGVPTGGIMAFGGPAAPTGYLLCDGASVSRSTYVDLWNAIGTTYGTASGTTFNVPDLRQRFPLGLAASGTGAVLGATGGNIDHVHTGPSHTHTIATHTHTIAHTHTVPTTGWGGLQVGGPTAAGHVLATDGAAMNLTEAQTAPTTSGSSAANSGGPSVPLSADANGTGNTGTANPPFQVVNYIIKT